MTTELNIGTVDAPADSAGLRHPRRLLLRGWIARTGAKRGAEDERRTQETAPRPQRTLRRLAASCERAASSERVQLLAAQVGAERLRHRADGGGGSCSVGWCA